MSVHNEAQPAPLVYTVEQAASVLGIGRNAVYEEIAAGSLKSFTHGRRRRIAHADLVAFVNALRKASQPAPVRPAVTRTSRRNAALRKASQPAPVRPAVTRTSRRNAATRGIQA